MPPRKINDVVTDAGAMTWYNCIDEGNLTRLTVPTQYGFVVVSIWVDSHDPAHDGTDLQFIHAGHLHTRSIVGQAYRPRYALTLARRFATEIANRKDAPVGGKQAA